MDCRAAAGTYLSGVVQSEPTFAPGQSLRGIELSHTHIALRGDGGSQTYVVAADNVFASGYLVHQSAVPTPLDTIHKGDHLEFCGIPHQGGMHFVHTNCGDRPTAQDPNGWLKELQSDGTPGQNLEDSTKYCYLWPRK